MMNQLSWEGSPVMRRFMLASASFVAVTTLMVTAAWAGSPPVTLPVEPQGLEGAGHSADRR